MPASVRDSSSDRRQPPPRWFWLMPLLAVVLRGVPYLVARWSAAGEGMVLAPTGYLPRDFFSYAAFIRQAAERGSWLLLDPYTTEAQQPRFILLFHWLLGWASRATGCDPMVVLEAARAPLIFLLFYSVWRFAGMLHQDRRRQLWAAALAGFSGGLEGVLLPYSTLAPPFVAERFREGVWHLYGWNTFQSMYNPLWIAGLVLTLWLLQAAWDRRKRFTWSSTLVLAGGLIFQFYLHPYSALATLAILPAGPVAAWFLGEEVPWRRTAWIASAMTAALGVIALISLWQTQDPIYRASSNNVLGPLDLSVFWYPATLGLVGCFALLTWVRWVREGHAYLSLMTGWVAAVVLLHASPILNGYHFVFHLHLPLSLLAASAVADFFAAPGPLRRTSWISLPQAVVALGLFASCVLTTSQSIGDVHRRNPLPGEYFALLDALREAPGGKVLAPAELGNLLPAYSPHRVWVGHWFLTPDYRARRAHYERAVSDPRDLSLLRELVRREQFDYLVAPRDVAEAWVRAEQGASLEPFQQWAIVRIEPTPSAPSRQFP